jgi:hypothetical protein
MRRSLLAGLAAGGMLLVVASGYTTFWFIAAARLEAGLAQLPQSLRPHRIDLSWRHLQVGGFPLALRVNLAGVELCDRAPPATSVTRLARLVAGAAPWNLFAWRLAAPDGVEIAAGGAAAPVATLRAKAASGALLYPSGGGIRAWFDLGEPHADGDIMLAAQHATVWLILPPHPPHSDTEPAVDFAVDAQLLSLPALPPPLRNPIDELAFGITVRGPVPTKPPRQAAAAWRDAGGTADVNDFALRSGGLTIVGSGSAALDSDLQPEGAFSLGVEDYPALLDALVAEQRLSPDGARLASLALAFLARRGPDGKPEIRTSLRMQNGKMFLGPIAIGPAPHIAW